MYIRCQEHKTAVVVHTGTAANVEYGDGHTIRIRFDDKKPFTQSWSEATNHEALFASNPIALAKQAALADNMLFEFTPFNSNTQQVKFMVTGLNHRLEEVAKLCKWKKGNADG